MTSIAASGSDRERIVEVCNSMAWYADRRRWQDLETLFTATVALDYTSLWGGDPSTIGRVDLISSWSETLGRLDGTQHILAGHLVSIAESGEAATCFANFQATHLGKVRHESAIWVLGGHYRFDFALVDAYWKIGGLTMTMVWETGPREVITVPT
jgi:hypothetical protein